MVDSARIVVKLQRAKLYFVEGTCAGAAAQAFSFASPVPRGRYLAECSSDLGVLAVLTQSGASDPSAPKPGSVLQIGTPGVPLHARTSAEREVQIDDGGQPLELHVVPYAAGATFVFTLTELPCSD